MSQDPQTLNEFFEAVGRRRFRLGIGRSEQLITRASSEGAMPAGWYRDVRDWCLANGVAVPEHLFKWGKRSKEPHNSKQNVNCRSGHQEAAE